MAATLAAMALSGCATVERTYPGAPRPPDAVALLVTEASQRVQVEAVDGAKVSPGTDRYEVLPGHHLLRLRVPRRDDPIFARSDRTTLAIEVEPGHTYRLRGSEDPRTSAWTPRLDDAGPPGPPLSAPPAALEVACRDGLPRACIELGIRSERGDRDLEWNEAFAARLYEHACALGDGEGCFRFADLNELGRGVSRDERRAVELFTRACDRHQWRACARLAALLENGGGAPKDERRATGLYEMACAKGDPGACYRLGARAREGASGPADYQRAAALFEAACTGGEPQGCTRLALLYENGLGVDQDEARAAALYERACDAGSALGCGNLGALYQLGLGVTRDMDRSVALLRKGCAKGAASACATLKSLAQDPSTQQVAAVPGPVPEPVCRDEVLTGSRIPVQVCETVPAPATPFGAEDAESLWSLLQVGVRGEGDLLQRGFVTGVALEVGDRFSGVVTLLTRAPLGFRLEGRFHPVAWSRLRLYVGLGSSIIVGAASGRGSAGVEIQALQLGAFQLRFSSDLAWEHFFNPGPAYAPDSLLVSLGVGLRL